MAEQLALIETGRPLRMEDDMDNHLERSRVWDVLRDHKWYTLYEIQYQIRGRFKAHYSDSSISARVRDWRKPSHGGHTIEKRLRSPRVWEYRLVGR